MAHIINCGEQDIEENGISINLSVIGEPDTFEDLFISIIDSLLGVSEFIAECKYDFAEVGIDVSVKKNVKGYKGFERFLNKEENKKLKELFQKYCKYSYQEPTKEENCIYYWFILDNINAEMTEEDHVEFCEIFKERLKGEIV